MIDSLGSSLPLLNEWNSQGTALLKPWVEGTLHFADLFTPHNEHRIVLSRVLTLGLFWLNEQWDSRFALVSNAVGFALLAVAVAAALWKLFGRRSRVFIFASVALWSALPYAYENTLWGFQSPFYILLFLSFLGIWGAGLHSVGSPWWLVGLGAALLACLSMASGFLAPVALVGLGALKVAKKQHSFQDFLITAALSLGMVALSLYFQVKVPQHEVLKAVSFSAWFAALGRALAWPFSGPPVAAVAVYFPVLALLISYCLKRRAVLDLERSRPVEALVCVAFWVVLQAAAIAYGRGGDGSQCPGSRHMDLLAPGVLVNLFAVVTLLSVNRQSSWIRCGANLAGTVWMMWVLYGVVGTSHDQFSRCLARHGGIRSDEEHVHATSPLVIADIWKALHGHFFRFPIRANSRCYSTTHRSDRFCPQWCGLRFESRKRAISGMVSYPAGILAKLQLPLMNGRGVHSRPWAAHRREQWRVGVSLHIYPTFSSKSRDICGRACRLQCAIAEPERIAELFPPRESIVIGEWDVSPSPEALSESSREMKIRKNGSPSASHVNLDDSPITQNCLPQRAKRFLSTASHSASSSSFRKSSMKRPGRTIVT
jgi:hypothetical protein